MRKRISIFLIFIFLFLLMCPNVSAEDADALPSPDWVTVTLNRDGTKNVSVNTPTYLLDTVASYIYSIDGGNTWQTISSNSGGDIIIDGSCEFRLKYTAVDERESDIYSVTVEINNVTVISSSSTGISLIIPKDSAMPTDVSLSCYEIINGVDYSAIASKIGANKPFILFNVTITRNNSVFDPKIENTFMFPTRSLDNRYCKLYHIDSSGNIEIIDSDSEMNVLYANTKLSGTFAVVEDKTFAKGDVNGDARINAADARLTLRASAQLDIMNNIQLISADVDNNGTVTAADARLILRASAGLEKI